jgi:hypothetical protein
MTEGPYIATFASFIVRLNAKRYCLKFCSFKLLLSRYPQGF